MNGNERLKEIAQRLSLMLLGKFKTELIEQGHVLDGTLRDSLEMQIESRVGGFTLTFLGLAYGIKLNDGVRAEEIPSKGSERYKQLVSDMAVYVTKRMGVTEGYRYKIAKNIIEKWRVDGMPTRRSYRYSKNGRRKGWIDYVLNNESQNIDDMVEEVLSIGMIDLIENEFVEFV